MCITNQYLYEIELDYKEIIIDVDKNSGIGMCYRLKCIENIMRFRNCSQRNIYNQYQNHLKIEKDTSNE